MTYKKLHTSLQPQQSAAIPFRVEGGHVEVLLITTRNRGKWIVPKGWIEADLASHMSAKKEALEEAGVRGWVSAVSLGCYRHGDSETDPVVEVFLMRVWDELDAWPEQRQRQRRWVSLEEAYEHVEEEGLRSILDEAAIIMRHALADEQNAHPAVPESGGGSR